MGLVEGLQGTGEEPGNTLAFAVFTPQGRRIQSPGDAAPGLYGPGEGTVARAHIQKPQPPYRHPPQKRPVDRRQGQPDAGLQVEQRDPVTVQFPGFVLFPGVVLGLWRLEGPGKPDIAPGTPIDLVAVRLVHPFKPGFVMAHGAAHRPEIIAPV